MEANKRSIRKSSRVVIAFAAGPAVASAAVVIFFLVLALLLGAHREVLATVVGELFVGMLVLSYSASVIVGIPGYLLFSRLGWIGRRHWFVLGATIGAMSGAIFVLVGMMINTRSVGSQARDAILAGVVIALVSAGVMGTMFAWLIRPKGPSLNEVAATFD